MSTLTTQAMTFQLTRGGVGQLGVGPRLQRLAGSSGQLALAQQALHERGLQDLDRPLAVRIGGSQVAAAGRPYRAGIMRFHRHERLPGRPNSRSLTGRLGDPPSRLALS
jgi:hypothetical protein